jgi:hypothetical protein
VTGSSTRSLTVDLDRPRVEISGGIHNGRVVEEDLQRRFRIDRPKESRFDLRIFKTGYRP